METVSPETIKSAVKTAWVRSLTEIQPDVLEALQQAAQRESSPRGRQYLEILIQNALRARETGIVICQDTGVPTFFVKTPLNFPYAGDIREPFDSALRELTAGEFPMRPMVVHPLKRTDRGDNTAANVLIDLLGMDAVNELRRRWRAEHTCLRRKMLDFAAHAAGRANCTTARDQYALYAGLWRRCRGDHPKQCWMLALDTLLRQRCQDAFLRYLNGPSPTVAHKTGGLDHVHHDAGIFQTAWGDYYLGCFTWEGPSLDGEPEQAQFLGRVGRQFYEVYS